MGGVGARPTGGRGPRGVEGDREDAVAHGAGERGGAFDRQEAHTATDGEDLAGQVGRWDTADPGRRDDDQPSLDAGQVPIGGQQGVQPVRRRAAAGQAQLARWDVAESGRGPSVNHGQDQVRQRPGNPGPPMR